MIKISSTQFCSKQYVFTLLCLFVYALILECFKHLRYVFSAVKETRVKIPVWSENSHWRVCCDFLISLSLFQTDRQVTAKHLKQFQPLLCMVRPLVGKCDRNWRLTPARNIHLSGESSKLFVFYIDSTSNERCHYSRSNNQRTIRREMTFRYWINKPNGYGGYSIPAEAWLPTFTLDDNKPR